MLNFICENNPMRSIRLLYLLPVFCCLLIILPSCEKQNDDTLPSVSILAPTELEEFSVGDSIRVIADISHGSPVSSIKVSLLNGNSIPVLDPIYIFPGATAFHLDRYFPVDENLESGLYTLLVSATDGTNTRNVYLKLSIRGLERFFERAIAICRPNTLKTLVYSIDEDGAFQNIRSLDYGYTDSDISSDQRQLYILKPNPDILYAYKLEDISEDYSITASPPYPIYNDVSYYNLFTYVATGNGYIKAYDKNGYPAFLTAPNVDTIPKLVKRHFSYVIAYCERRGGPERFLRQYHAGTGIFRAGIKINFSAVEIFSTSPDFVVLLGNKETESSVFVYNSVDYNLEEEIPLPAGLISGGVQISSNVFLISHENGIYQYNHETKTVIAWLTGVEADVIAYDDLRQLVYFSEDEKVYVCRVTDAVTVQEITLPYEILNLHIQYNN